MTQHKTIWASKFLINSLQVQFYSADICTETDKNAAKKMRRNHKPISCVIIILQKCLHINLVEKTQNEKKKQFLIRFLTTSTQK